MSSLLSAHEIQKSFAGVPVLWGVSLELQAGEVHAVMGENGAGKSTLMKVLAGLLRPDSGEVRLDGRKVEFRHAHDALRGGVAMIHQELMPFPNLTVAENVLIGQEPCSRWTGWIDRKRLHSEAARLLARFRVPLCPSQAMSKLSVAEMQTVEIAKALAHEVRVLIMDEPTSALSEQEVDALFEIIQDLRKRGVGILYISHKLAEVQRLADRVTILRDGRNVSTHPMGEITSDRLVSLMAGREMKAGASSCQETRKYSGTPVLSVRGLTRQGEFRGVSFEVRKGEVLGFAGLMGAGRTELVNAVYGLDPADEGEIWMENQPLTVRSPGDALASGIGLVTEDRKEYGFIPKLSVRQNITLAALTQWTRWGLIDHGAELRMVEEQIRRFRVKTRHGDEAMECLSGGNQQKIVIARTLLAQPKVLLLDEPTRGIDVAAKLEVHEIIRELAKGGMAVVLVSSELPELFSLCDRILVMRQGTVVAERFPARSTPEEILALAMHV